MKRYLTTVLLAAACGLRLQAATLERLSLDELIAKSTGIVRGTVADSWTTFDGRDITTHYRISVAERFKGGAQKTVEVLVHGGVYGEYHQTPAGSPVLSRGDQYVFFLWTNAAGNTWITGMTQGLFLLDRTASADPVATRAASRELMLDAATAQPVKDSAVSLKLSALRGRITTVLSQGGVK